jgi:GNAT superfamily N-acetyltransferase
MVNLNDPLELARLIEGANVDALMGHAPILRRLFPDSDPATLHVGGGVASFVGASAVSYAVGLGMDRKVTVEEIAEVVEFYRSRGAVPRVDVCPLADESLLAALRAHHFSLHWFVNVLVRPLVAAEEFPPPPPGIVIREAGPEDAELWATVADECFSDGSPMTEARRRLGLLLFHGETTTPFLVEADGQIAAAGAMFLYREYAALAAAGVRAPFRKRGIHSALINIRLKKARDLGCTVAGLFATPGNQSNRNAERHGFHVAYTKAVMRLTD